jgi:hypothetical protein
VSIGSLRGGTEPIDVLLQFDGDTKCLVAAAGAGVGGEPDFVR